MDGVVFNLGKTVECYGMTQGSSPGFVLFNISYGSYNRHRKMPVESEANHYWWVREIAVRQRI